MGLQQNIAGRQVRTSQTLQHHTQSRCTNVKAVLMLRCEALRLGRSSAHAFSSTFGKCTIWKQIVMTSLVPGSFP